MTSTDMTRDDSLGGDPGHRVEAGYLVTVPVRWSDMDVFRHVNHARMVTILEEARIPWLFYDDRPTVRMRTGCVVADLHVRYQGQLRHDETPLEVTMFTTSVRAADFTVGYEVRPAGGSPQSRPAVAATTQLVSFDVETQRPRRITPDEKEYLRSFLRAGAVGSARTGRR